MLHLTVRQMDTDRHIKPDHWFVLNNFICIAPFKQTVQIASQANDKMLKNY